MVSMDQHSRRDKKDCNSWPSRKRRAFPGLNLPTGFAMCDDLNGSVESCSSGVHWTTSTCTWWIWGGVSHWMTSGNIRWAGCSGSNVGPQWTVCAKAKQRWFRHILVQWRIRGGGGSPQRLVGLFCLSVYENPADLDPNPSPSKNSSPEPPPPPPLEEFLDPPPLWLRLEQLVGMISQWSNNVLVSLGTCRQNWARATPHESVLADYVWITKGRDVVLYELSQQWNGWPQDQRAHFYVNALISQQHQHRDERSL